MLYLAGFIITSLASVSAVGYLFTSLQRKSHLNPPVRAEQMPPQIRSHALITFSLILPFSALAFLTLTFAAMKIIRAQQEAHLQMVIGSLAVPTLCFLLGYFYFKRVVRL